MALWLVRTGKHGEHEQRFFADNRIYLTWGGLKHDLSKLPTQRDLSSLLKEVYPDRKMGHVRNNTGQIWAFARKMKPGDWVIIPSKKKPAIHVAEITGSYVFDASADDRYHHSREVKWVERDVPRSIFDHDLLYSFDAFMTVFEVRRNDAERRVRTLAVGGWKTGSGVKPPKPKEDDDVDDGEEGEVRDLEQLARDQIAQLINRKFKGHGLARLVEAILQAQDYTTFRSPEGPDKGVDLLAAPGPLGFGNPRLCVQVKSGDSPVDSPTLNQLIGAMQNVKADQGLLVSWGGFRSSVDKEVPTQFFRVRLWDQGDLIKELLAHYDRLDEDIQAELPLKHIWTVAIQDDEP
jgi:restriction system protein